MPSAEEVDWWLCEGRHSPCWAEILAAEADGARRILLRRVSCWFTVGPPVSTSFPGHHCLHLVTGFINRYFGRKVVITVSRYGWQTDIGIRAECIVKYAAKLFANHPIRDVRILNRPH